MASYTGTDEFEGARFERVSFRGATMRGVDLGGVRVRGADLGGLDLDSHDLVLGTLVVNGVDVVPLVEAELDRRFPGREHQRAQTPEGLRAGWVAVQEAWATTVADTPAELRDVQVYGEWSLAQTLRHLVLATDTWLLGAVQRVERPWHEIGLLFDGAERMGVDTSRFRVDPPDFEEVLEVRAERQQRVTRHLASLTPEELAEERSDPWGFDWTPTVGDCLRTVLEEEWAHLRYVRRDLALLQA